MEEDARAPESGLILGKFLPPHLGHQYLFDFARAYVRRLTVLVCSLAREPIPGTLRLQWVREMSPDALVLDLADENPSEPKEHPDFWQIWTDSIRRRVPAGPDVVFTSEDYGNELARRLGARHIIVDRARELVPVSGAKIRQRPLENWCYLPACVRPYFVKRVVVFGPESTGKTTLCQQLARHYQTVWVSEYARGHLDNKGAVCDPDDLPPIVRGHIASEEALARQANRVLFLDTDPLQTVMYSHLYYNSCPKWIEELAARRSYDLYLVTDVDVPWVPDPQRDMPHRRDEVRDRCVALLEAHRRSYVVVRGDWAARFETARRVVDELLREAKE